jgi:hypothetical protein
VSLRNAETLVEEEVTSPSLSGTQRLNMSTPFGTKEAPTVVDQSVTAVGTFGEFCDRQIPTGGGDA